MKDVSYFLENSMPKNERRESYFLENNMSIVLSKKKFSGKLDLAAVAFVFALSVHPCLVTKRECTKSTDVPHATLCPLAMART